MADALYRATSALFRQVPDGTAYRLIGAGLSDLCAATESDRSGDLLDPNAKKHSEAERASDAIRKKFGADAIIKGRSLR